MNNYIEYNDRVAFHPGYYIKEIVEQSGLTQKDFAKGLILRPRILVYSFEENKIFLLISL